MARSLILLVLWTALSAAQADCFERAGQRFAIHPNLLRAIAAQESNYQVNAVGPVGKSGHRALGMMQIYTVHLPELARHGVHREHLFTECGSVFVGGWILAGYVAKAGGTWRAVGFYYTGPSSKNRAAQDWYIASVRRRFDRLQRKPQVRVQQGQPALAAMTVWSSE